MRGSFPTIAVIVLAVQGAALVFLITGPATNSAAVTTLWKVLGKKATLLYLATVAVCALAVTFHVQLLEVVRQAAQIMVIRQDGMGLCIPEIVVPDAEQCHYHREILLQRGIPEVGIHRMCAGQQTPEVVHTNGQCYGQANGRPEGVAAANPVPNREYILGLDTEVFCRWNVCGNCQEVPCDRRLITAVPEEPFPRHLAVFEGFLRAE